jgi:hypothetical protein
LFYLEEASKIASAIQSHFPEYIDVDAKHALSSALWMGNATTGVWPSVGAAVEFSCRIACAIGQNTTPMRLNIMPTGRLISVVQTLVVGTFLGMVAKKHGRDEAERLTKLPVLSEQERHS